MRAFVAVEITNPTIRDNIRELQARLVPPAESKSVKMVNADMLHFTLQFLGNIADSEAVRVADALSSVRFEPFDLEVREVGAFPDARRPRTVWVGGAAARADNGDVDNQKSSSFGDPLAVLAQRVAEALCPLGHTRDKPFRAHSTIFRVKDKKNNPDITIAGLEKMAAKSFGTQQVDQIKLKSSTLTQNGPIYSDVAVISAGDTDQK